MIKKIKIKLEDITAGEIVRDIYDEQGQLLLSKGSILSAATVKSLQGRNIHEVYIMLEVPDLPPPRKPDSIEVSPKSPTNPGSVQIGEVYGKALNFVEGFMCDLRNNKSLDIPAVEKTVSFFSDSMLSDSDLLKQLRMIKNKDDYLYTHSVNVSVLSIMIGKWMEYDATTVKKLGMAAMLHDVGKVNIPDEILHKPAALTENEYQIIKNHSVIGYRMMQEYKDLDPQIMYGVLMHHERMDGSGYPAGIGYGKIPAMASVIAIADTYDAITSKRVYSEKRTPYVAAEEILKESLAGKVDQRISKVFYDHLLALAVDNKVLLSNKEIGQVVLVNPLKPANPVVKVNDTLYYLGRDPGITIVDVID